MKQNIQAIRGMNDILPEQVLYWQYLEETLRSLTKSYGFQEIRFPIIESTALFKRSIGEVTDIVTKEMYTFLDRNQDSLTLRPEGTAGCVRAGIQHGLLYNQIQRLWYMGPMFRHERPQKGRYRQFYQFGAEIFGLNDPSSDAELILMCQKLWQQLQIQDQLTLHLNSLGTKESRKNYHTKLQEYFTKHKSSLDQDSLQRLDMNPLRILDSKNPKMQQLINNAPSLLDYLDEDSKQHFRAVQEILAATNIKYILNPKLVRGLDYYGMTVFEWITNDQKAQNAVCAGGRYNDLVSQLGGKPIPAAGFAIGLERIIELMQSITTLIYTPDIYFILVNEAAAQKALLLAEQLRQDFPQLQIITNYTGGSFKTQFRKANNSGAKLALILGDDEMAHNTVTIKDLRSNKDQVTVATSKLKDFVIT